MWEICGNMYDRTNVGDHLRFDYGSRTIYEVMEKADGLFAVRNIKFDGDDTIFRGVSPSMFTLIKRVEVGME